MTHSDKILALKAAISPDIETDELLGALLLDAESLILNKMYPFGYPDGTAVPARYEQIQIMLAVERYTQRGAEGQTSHSENGTSRAWPTESALLKRIVPRVGSVGSV